MEGANLPPLPAKTRDVVEAFLQSLDELPPLYPEYSQTAHLLEQVDESIEFPSPSTLTESNLREFLQSRDITPPSERSCTSPSSNAMSGNTHSTRVPYSQPIYPKLLAERGVVRSSKLAENWDQLKSILHAERPGTNPPSQDESQKLVPSTSSIK